MHTGAYEYVSVFGRTNLAMWDGLLDEGYRITGVGGSDDHSAGMGTGATDSAIGSPTTVVFADELSEAAVTRAVREGRVVLKLRGPDDPMVELRASAGATEGIIGDTLAGESIQLQANVQGGTGKLLVLYENGAQVEDVVSIDSDDFVQSWTRPVPADGARYRAHVLEGSSLLVITNHIYADYEEARASGDSGCGCNSSNSAPPLWILAGLALLLWRRRTPRDSRNNS